MSLTKDELQIIISCLEQLEEDYDPVNWQSALTKCKTLLSQIPYLIDENRNSLPVSSPEEENVDARASVRRNFARWR